MDTYKKFLQKDAAAQPKVERCSIHDSTYSPGSQCYYCRTGYERKDLNSDLMPKASAVKRVAKARAKAGVPPADKLQAEVLARLTDPKTAHDGVARIHQFLSENRQRILALDFPTRGLNYRDIAEQADIYPTTASRTITTMYRNGDLMRVGKDGGFLYLPKTAAAGQDDEDAGE